MLSAAFNQIVSNPLTIDGCRDSVESVFKRGKHHIQKGTDAERPWKTYMRKTTGYMYRKSQNGDTRINNSIIKPREAGDINRPVRNLPTHLHFSQIKKAPEVHSQVTTIPVQAAAPWAPNSPPKFTVIVEQNETYGTIKRNQPTLVS